MMAIFEDARDKRQTPLYDSAVRVDLNFAQGSAIIVLDATGVAPNNISILVGDSSYTLAANFRI